MQSLNESEICSEREELSRTNMKNPERAKAQTATGKRRHGGGVMSPSAMVNPTDEFPFFDNEVVVATGAKKGIKNLNIEDLQLRAVLRIMENRFERY